MTGRTLSYYGVALPICGIEQEPQKNYRIKGEILGTCFGIGNSYLMTAAHVVNELTATQPDAAVMLLNPEGHLFHLAPVIDTETLDRYRHSSN